MQEKKHVGGTKTTTAKLMPDRMPVAAAPTSIDR